MEKTGINTCILLAAVVTSGVTARATYAEGDLRRQAPLEWGIYQIYWRADYGAYLAQQVERLASQPDYVMFYRDLSRPFPSQAIDAIRSFGATPIISLELWNWHGGEKDHLRRIAAGEYDDHFRRWAQDAKRYGGRVLLRFGFEFNGNWFTWGGDPEHFVRAWRRVRKIFDDVEASNVEWVWAPNVTSHPEGRDNDMEHYWPGGRYVDWVGVDGYNWGDDYDEWHRWSSFEEVFGKVLDRFAKRYRDKPVMIAEFGCVEGTPGRKAAWIRDAHASVLRRPQVKVVVWFNFDKRRERELDWRLDSSP